MTTAKEAKFKELTVKQYEFYKRKGLSDDKVMKMHGYHTVNFNAWKKENNLIGVKFEADVKVTSEPTPEVSPLKENDIDIKAVVSKPFVKHSPDKIAEDNGNPSDPATEQLIADLRRDLKESEKQRYAEIERGDEWRNKFLAVEEELKDLQDEFDRADNAHDRESEVTERKHEIEVANLKHEIQLLNKALEKHAEDEQLTVLLMKKAASFAERFAE